MVEEKEQLLLEQDDFSLAQLLSELEIPSEYLTDEGEFYPVLLVEQASEDTAQDLANFLHICLSQEVLPESIREDIKMRILDLYQRFPKTFASIA